MMDAATARALDLLEQMVNAPNYTADPVQWVTDRLDGFLWSKQREIIESVRDNRHTTVQSGHATGKSQLAAFITAWWLAAHPPGTAMVVSTAPTYRQVRAILWRYIGRAHRKGKLPGRVTQVEWHMTDDGTHYATPRPGEELVGFGSKPSDHDPGAFQGTHARYVLVIVDEAGAVEGPLWDAIESLATNDDCRVLAIGNPDNPRSYFATICAPGSGWNTIHVSCLDTPNMTGEVVPDWLRPLLVSQTWVDERKARWGEDSAVYTAKVLGLFPKDASDGVIPHSWMRQCQGDRTWTPEQLAPVVLGIDIGASDNGDQTVVRERRGVKLGRVWRYREKDHVKLAAIITRHIHETGATEVNIDSTGVGHGIVDILTTAGHNRQHKATIHGVNFGAGAGEKTRFANVRAEMHWGFRELCEQAAIDLNEADDDVIHELSLPTWATDGTGRTKVLPKADVAARLGRSPDDGDAVMLAYYTPPTTFIGYARSY